MILPSSFLGTLSMKRTPPRSFSSSMTSSVVQITQINAQFITYTLPPLFQLLPLVKSINSSAVAEWPFLRTTKAVGSSPSTSSGCPTTPTSSTAGWVIICFSMFVGTTYIQVAVSIIQYKKWDQLTWAILYLMSSLKRPMMNKFSFSS